jgi:hypothetical protein
VWTRTGRTTRDPERASLFFVPFYASSSRTASRLATQNLYQQLKTHLRTSAPYWDRCERRRWETAHAAVSRRPPIPLKARTRMYAYGAHVWDVSIVQGHFLTRRASFLSYDSHNFLIAVSGGAVWGGSGRRYGGHDHVFVLGRHYTERTAFGRSSLSLALEVSE